jgi:hypothetical protein
VQRRHGFAPAAFVVVALAACAAPIQPASTATLPAATASASAAPVADAWTGITWRKLAATDPLATIQAVSRTSHGFIARGLPRSTDSGFRTPILTSADGLAWSELPAPVVGADSIVLGFYELSGRLVALTLAGGAVKCPDSEDHCLEVRPPLRAWSSDDGTEWTLRAEPINIDAAPGHGLLEFNTQAALVGGRLVAVERGKPLQIALSNDGLTWSTVSAIGLPPDFWGGLAGAAGGGFVLAGSSGSGNQQAPSVAWSADASRWESTKIPITAQTAGRAAGSAAGRAGMILVVTTDEVPGGTQWWGSSTGTDWQPIMNFAPLGVWRGAGEGTALMPNGQLVSDGERIVAYDTVSGNAAWASFDGSSWTELTIAGNRPPAADPFPGDYVTVTPIGLLWRDRQGSAWFGEASR